MMRTVIKWIHRCLGWMVLACCVLSALFVYAMDRKIGYGQLEVWVSWQGNVYALDEHAIASADFSLGKRRRPLELGRAIRLRPGPVTLEVKVKDFCSCTIITNIVKNAKAVVELPLTPESRIITVGGLISNSAINGQPQTSQAGVWTLKNAVVGQSYRIEAAAPGYYTNILALRIEKPGEDLVTNLLWRPLTGFVSAQVRPILDGTTVFIDGRPMSLSVEPAKVGMHLISVSNNDYLAWEQSVSVAYELTNHCDVVLKPKPAWLSLDVSPSVEYQLQEESGDLIELHNDTAMLPPGTNLIIISARWCVPQHQQFVTKPNGRYSWKVQLEKKGLQDFNKAKAQFDALMGNNLTLLGKYGGREWDRIQGLGFDTDDLLHGVQQYNQARTDLVTLLERCKTLDAQQAQIDRQNAAEAAEKQALVDSARVMATRIDDLFSGRTGDDIAWSAAMERASDLVGDYERQFGEGTQYEKRVGSVAAQVKEWRRRISLSR